MPGAVDPDNLPAGTQLGYYRVVRRIGAGGFGTLYEVERDGRSYALKLSRERLGAMTAVERARFEDRTDREVASLKQLSHPNIVKVHAVDRWPELESGHPYLVMDFVRGEVLRAWCEKNLPSPARICALFEKVARAVHYMHLRHVYHRDLKSENVLVREDGEPVIIDFGIARGRGSFRVTRHAAMVGTATHYAPEYLRHRETEAYERGEEFQWTSATDLHSVGYMLYEALTGEPPFSGDDELRLWKAIRELVPRAPSLVNPAVPRALDVVVLKLLAKDPLDRHHSGQELAEELRVLAEHQGSESSWSQPLERPHHSSTETVPAAGLQSEPDLEGIEELLETPIARAAADLVEALPKSALPSEQHPSAEPVEANGPDSAATSAVPAPSHDSPIRVLTSEIRDDLVRSMPRQAGGRRALVAATMAAAFVVLLAVVLMSLRRGETQKPTSLMAKATRDRASASDPGRRTETAPMTPPRRDEKPPARDPSPASVPDARAIDREIEERYGGRPTVTRDGQITAIPSSQPLAPPGNVSGAAPKPEAKTASSSNEASARPTAPAEPSWLKRSTTLDAAVLVAQRTASAPKPLGVPTGAHIPARLLTTLDSRTVGNGPAEARLTRPFVLRGDVVLPAGTLAFGKASSAEGRFVVKFDRLRLPDDHEIEFTALAMDRGDGKPGLAASRRVAGQASHESSNVGAAVAKSSAETLLGTVTGGLGQDLVRGAGQVALQARPSESSGSSEIQILDPGVVFDLWVEHPF